MSSILRAPLAAALLALLTSAHAAPAPVRDTPETIHGVTVHDPYRYFENVKDPEVLKWMRDQGAQARQVLDAIPGRDALGKRVAQLSEASGDSYTNIVRMPGDRLYSLKRARGERQAKLVVRQGGKERLLVDPEVEARRTGVPHAINYFRPSWDGAYVAYGMSAGGSEDASLYIHDVKAGKAVGQPIPRVREANVSWLPDSRSFTYNQLRALDPETPETEAYQDSNVMWQRVGAPAAQARAVFGPTVNKQLGLVRLDVGAIVFEPGSRWMVVRTTDTTAPEGSLFVAQVSDLAKGGDVPWKRIASPSDAIVDIELAGDQLYFQTHKDAPLFKVMKLDLRQPQLARAVEVARPPAGAVLEGFNVGRAGVLGSVREGTAIGLRLYTAGDTAGRAVPLPFHGAAGVHADPAHAYDDWLYTLTGWTEPARDFRLHGMKSTDTGLRQPKKVPGAPEIVVTEVQVRSHDGVEVPLTLVHKKGLKRDGSNPTLLFGYGAYGFSFTAAYRPTSIAWLERGGILAYANVRGSGVHGEPWHLAGFKQTKRNTWKDGIACAQWLVAQRYASPATMGALGGSAGGIFVGRMVTEAPQLFAAAIFEVGVMDAVRAEESANGVTNISEFGSWRNPQEFPALLEMSTYHQVKDGTPYPAVMLVHGVNDPRVDVWHSAKAAARLQAATTSGKPILLRLDEQAGHGMGSTRTQRDALTADVYAFLLWQMGKMKR
ncbi:prolyl oligopeptidase family serine peptidase [Ramlibacter algicola]|uniref:prolyl oligopeptidase n=1 Tax=Ramlibacter algicola TaxID=2795217 RepID=A0A934PZN2_9BURK|nr:prolyl oligopeptidase family serine peptidase [Ramlibacter algicola]MBK0392338.1 S9 family peptidase [Ramlibacter algicola]